MCRIGEVSVRISKVSVPARAHNGNQLTASLRALLRRLPRETCDERTESIHHKQFGTTIARHRRFAPDDACPLGQGRRRRRRRRRADGYHDGRLPQRGEQAPGRRRSARLAIRPELAALCLAAVGIWGTLGPFWAMSSEFLSGTGAAAGIALINSVGNLGGFLGPYLVGLVRKETDSFALALLALAMWPLIGAIITVLTRSHHE